MAPTKKERTQGPPAKKSFIFLYLFYFFNIYFSFLILFLCHLFLYILFYYFIFEKIYILIISFVIYFIVELSQVFKGFPLNPILGFAHFFAVYINVRIISEKCTRTEQQERYVFRQCKGFKQPFSAKFIIILVNVENMRSRKLSKQSRQIRKCKISKTNSDHFGTITVCSM